MTLQRSDFRSYILRIFGLILLAASLVLGFLELMICNRILMFPFYHFMGASARLRAINYVSWVLLGIGFLIFLVVTIEYHLTHLAKPRSWVLFIKTFSVQLLIFVLGLFI